MILKNLSVFFIYKKIRQYPKKEYKTLDKRSLRKHYPFTWSQAVINGNTVEMPATARQLKLLEKANTLVITDYIAAPDELTPPTRTGFYFISGTPLPVEIFYLRKMENNYELWLNYSRNKELIGEPERDDFHLLNFERNKPVQVIINGKKEVMEKGSLERIYIEQAYVLEYAGELDVIADKKQRGQVKRTILFEEAKIINLRRLFY